MPKLLVLQEKIACMKQKSPIRVVIKTKSEIKMTSSEDLFDTFKHVISNVNGIEEPIYGLKIHVEYAPGVWIDVMRYLRLGLQAEEKEARNTKK